MVRVYSTYYKYTRVIGNKGSSSYKEMVALFLESKVGVFVPVCVCACVCVQCLCVFFCVFVMSVHLYMCVCMPLCVCVCVVPPARECCAV